MSTPAVCPAATVTTAESTRRTAMLSPSVALSALTA